MGYLKLGSEQVGTKKRWGEPLSKLLIVLPLNMYSDKRNNGMILGKTIISSNDLK